MRRIVAYLMITLSLISAGALMQCIVFPERGGGLIDVVVSILIIGITCKIIDKDWINL